MVNDDYNAACALEAQLVLWGCVSNGDDYSEEPVLDLTIPFPLPAAGECPVFEPFRCPKEGLCISIQVEIRPHLHTIFFAQSVPLRWSS